MCLPHFDKYQGPIRQRKNIFKGGLVLRKTCTLQWNYLRVEHGINRQECSVTFQRHIINCPWFWNIFRKTLFLGPRCSCSNLKTNSHLSWSAVKTSKRSAMDPIPKNGCSEIVNPNKTHTKFTHRTCRDVGTNKQSRTQIFAFLILRYFMISRQKHDGDFGKKPGPGLDFIVPFFEFGAQSRLPSLLGKGPTTNGWSMAIAPVHTGPSNVHCRMPGSQPRMARRVETWSLQLLSCFSLSMFIQFGSHPGMMVVQLHQC